MWGLKGGEVERLKGLKGLKVERWKGLVRWLSLSKPEPDTLKGLKGLKGGKVGRVRKVKCPKPGRKYPCGNRDEAKATLPGGGAFLLF